MTPLKLNKQNVSNKTTYSGYSKPEVYSLLLQSILTKDIHSCCYVSAELLCTKTELNSIIIFIIDTLCTHYHSYNTYYICDIVTKLKALSSLSRRNIPRNPHAQQYLCEIIILLTTFLKEKDFHEEYIERYSKDMQIVIESELYNVKVLEDIHIFIHTLFQDFPFEIQRYLHILYNFIKRGDKQHTIQFAHYLLMNTDIQGLVSQYEIDYQFGQACKIDKNDIAVILWKLIIQYIDNKQPENKQYISDLYFLYAFNYTKQKRSTRIMMIYNALLCIVTPKLFKNKEKTVDRAIVEEAKSKIYIIYDEILGPLISHERVEKQVEPKVDEYKPVSDQKEKVRHNMDYLKMCIWGEGE